MLGQNIERVLWRTAPSTKPKARDELVDPSGGTHVKIRHQFRAEVSWSDVALEAHLAPPEKLYEENLYPCTHKPGQTPTVIYIYVFVSNEISTAPDY